MIAVLPVFLTGCSVLGGTFSVDRFLYKDISGDTAGACMARSYQAWARYKAWVQVNYAGAAELAERAEAAQVGRTRPASSRGAQVSPIWAKSPATECACASAAVEAERLACSGPNDDKAALKVRFDKAAAACEGR